MTDKSRAKFEIVGGEKELWDDFESLLLSQDYIEQIGVKMVCASATLSVVND